MERKEVSRDGAETCAVLGVKSEKGGERVKEIKRSGST